MATPDSPGAEKPPKKQILLNAFDMSTVGHLSVGHWKVGGILFNEKRKCADTCTEPG
jgi:hypothetical protein